MSEDEFKELEKDRAVGWRLKHVREEGLNTK